MYCSKQKGWKRGRKTISQWHLWCMLKMCGLLKGKHLLICCVKEIQRYHPLRNMTQALNRSYSISSGIYTIQCRGRAFSSCYIYICYFFKHKQIPFCRRWLCLSFFTVSKDGDILTGGVIQVGRNPRMHYNGLLRAPKVASSPGWKSALMGPVPLTILLTLWICSHLPVPSLCIKELKTGCSNLRGLMSKEASWVKNLQLPSRESLTAITDITWKYISMIYASSRQICNDVPMICFSQLCPQ